MEQSQTQRLNLTKISSNASCSLEEIFDARTPDQNLIFQVSCHKLCWGLTGANIAKAVSQPGSLRLGKTDSESRGTRRQSNHVYRRCLLAVQENDGRADQSDAGPIAERALVCPQGSLAGNQRLSRHQSDLEGHSLHPSKFAPERPQSFPQFGFWG